MTPHGPPEGGALKDRSSASVSELHTLIDMNASSVAASPSPALLDFDSLELNCRVEPSGAGTFSLKCGRARPLRPGQGISRNAVALVGSNGRDAGARAHTEETCSKANVARPVLRAVSDGIIVRYA